MLSKSVIVCFFLKSMLKKRDQTWLQSILAAHLLQNKNNTPLTRHRTKVNVVEDKVQVFYSEQQQSRKMTDHQHVSITATAPHCEWLMMSHDWWQTGAGPWSKNDNKWHKTAEEKKWQTLVDERCLLLTTEPWPRVSVGGVGSTDRWRPGVRLCRQENYSWALSEGKTKTLPEWNWFFRCWPLDGTSFPFWADCGRQQEQWRGNPWNEQIA